MVNILANRRSIWAYNWRYQAEKTADQLAATLNEYGIGTLQQEVCYGLRFQGELPTDRVTPIYSIQDVLTLSGQLLNYGIDMSPVFVPQGLPGEAELHGKIARQIGHCVVDIEWDSSGEYWSVPGNLIKVYFDYLRRSAGNDCFIVSQPDSRIANSSRELEFQYVAKDCVPFINAFAPQTYVSWTRYDAVIANDIWRIQRFQELGLPVYPTLYTSELESNGTAWVDLGNRAIDQLGVNGLCAFRLGATNKQRLQAFKDLPIRNADPLPPNPIEDKLFTLPEVIDLRDQLNNHIFGIAATRDQLDEVIKQHE